jgi:hypothetical protein
LAKNRPACSSPPRLPPSRRKHTVLRATICSRIAAPLYRGADPRMSQAAIPSRLLFSGYRHVANRTRAASGKPFLTAYCQVNMTCAHTLARRRGASRWIARR